MLLAFGVPTLIAALAMEAPPVHVATSTITAPVQQLNVGSEIGPTVTGRYRLHLRFTNESYQPIKRVVFALNDGTMIVDVGTFSPGVMIDHTFDRVADDADSCTLVSATFADGTQWRPGRPQAQEAVPANVSRP